MLPSLEFLAGPLKLMVKMSHSCKVREQHVELGIGSCHNYKAWFDFSKDDWREGCEYIVKEVLNAENKYGAKQ